MTLLGPSDNVPLREDGAGVLRVGNSRVLLGLVIHAFQDGATPETICQRYDTLALADVYAVVSYYLRHRKEVESYLSRRERETNETSERMKAREGDLSEIRARIQARRRA
jgi:uncharacterized protein (DUF433 family)